jgi:hypothetical protein
MTQINFAGVQVVPGLDLPCLAKLTLLLSCAG